jgi:hypothetical protein
LEKRVIPSAPVDMSGIIRIISAHDEQQMQLLRAQLVQNEQQAQLRRAQHVAPVRRPTLKKLPQRLIGVLSVRRTRNLTFIPVMKIGKAEISFETAETEPNGNKTFRCARMVGCKCRGKFNIQTTKEQNIWTFIKGFEINKHTCIA